MIGKKVFRRLTQLSSSNFHSGIDLKQQLFRNINANIPLRGHYDKQFTVSAYRTRTNFLNPLKYCRTSYCYCNKVYADSLKEFLGPQKAVINITSSSSSSSSLPPPKKKSFDFGKGPISWKSLSIVSVVGGCILLFVMYIKEERRREKAWQRQRALGKAKIGGSFDLIDHFGNPRKSDEFLGQWLLIYFGFTHCPDVCPDELEKMATVVDNIDALKQLPKGIQPLFITVDPSRDSVESIKKYCAEFHPKLLGLTGSTEKIAEACKAYRVYFSEGPKDEDEDYIVDHTIIIYLVDPDGHFVDYYGQTYNAEQVTASISMNIEKFNALKKPGVIGVFGL